MGVVLRFSGSSKLTALAVKFYTWSWCSHVETIIDDSFLGPRLYGALPKTGVGFRSVDSTMGDRVEEYEVQIVNTKKKKYLEKLLSQQGKPYDYTALAFMLFHRDRNWKEDDSWFCSELVVWAFEEAGLHIIRTDHLNRITPQDLLMSPLLRRIK